ncbi:hypothetical protein GDO78_004584 [Eleutherodactylus coqui]|uniref:DBF4-type domain-containing protein n=1 Tax=Eleutherodactylus coqui TaxID=57060 RepID=A0A8J6JYE3_ELECQ|nr:hypothetical protein GDO78_004584 [Eleutherodactylus coqui]
MLDKKKTITFMGKLFYMDLPHNKQTQLLSKAIVRRGGVSNEVLSSNRHLHVLKAADVTNGEPNGRKGNGSQHPAAENIEKPPYSRGKQLLKKVVQSQECSSVLSSARSWGVCILHLDVGKLKSPFLKIEDQSREYCPIHCSFSNFPECSFISSDRSPFETAPTNNSTHKDPRDQKEGEKPRNWEKIGYCECCQITYQKLSEHLISKQHCRFALKASNYRAIDDLASLIHYDFVPLPPGTAPSVDAQDPEPTVPNVDCGGGKRKHCWSPCQPAGKRQPLSCQPMPLWVLHHLPSSANQPIVPMFSDWVDRDCNNRAAEDEGTTLPTFCYNPKMVQYDASSESDWDSHLASLRHNNPHQTAHFGELRTAQVSLDESCYGKQLCSVLSHEQTLGSPGATQTVTLSHTSCDIFLSGVAS